jgi:hypothetical protein
VLCFVHFDLLLGSLFIFNYANLPRMHKAEMT